MKVTPSFLISALARTDITRITGDLYDLQRQTSSSYLADDLKGYGDNAGRIINARSVIAQTEARKASAERVQARFDIQDASLEKASSAASQLRLDLLNAAGTKNGSFVAEQLETAFAQARGALNQTYDGQPLFAGERAGGETIRVTTLADLSLATTDAQVFNESTRPQTVDLGLGAPFVVADKASDISRNLFDAFRTLYDELQASTFGNPLTQAQQDSLVAIAGSLETARGTVVDAQGRSGDANARLGREIERLTAQGSLVENHLSSVAEADLAEVSAKISATNTQYQAIAKVFSDIRNLTLVNFLD